MSNTAHTLTAPTADEFLQVMRAYLATLPDDHSDPIVHAVLLRRLLTSFRTVVPLGPYTVKPTSAPWTDGLAFEARWLDGRTLIVATRCYPRRPDSRLTLYRANQVVYAVSTAHEQLPGAIGLCLQMGT